MTGTEAAASLVTQQLDEGIAAWAELARQVAEPTVREQVEAAGRVVVAALQSGHTLLVAGNGGSAAIASHVAAEFLGKCIHDRHPLPAISLAESHSSLTAIGNDYGFDQVFLRGVQAFGRPGDVFLAMSTSGTSPNVVAALAEARSRGLATILMTGSKGAGQADLADHLLVVPSSQTPRIQEVHMLWAHAWCEAVDLVMQDAP
ncbi:D-sedoheptulose-7-phosphate isomerase [Janibacter hoylei]|uniref:D-sedoheptulose-7-phosphate isomerase n=1 Tax=Janibacter hoylei TaxID=364298 RepID=UPI0021A34263|nr:SIS domain-containing protein [Janibacter hoylei]MCT1619360.1 SIS domain-containing protein [Janibacter hoylei]MCT2294072.1 SIS domain-containing protein [Janibacter hoylei]